MIIDENTYFSVKTRLNAINDMNKIARKLESEVKEIQNSCKHNIFLLTDIREENSKKIFSLTCPFCLKQKEITSLEKEEEDNNVLILDASFYPHRSHASAQERILEIVNAFYYTLNAEDVLDDVTLGYHFYHKLLEKTRRK